MDTNFEAALNGFLTTAQVKVDAAYADSTTQTVKLEAEVGPKYIRIVSKGTHTRSGEVTSRSAYCFIDRTNGNVLKSAGWKGPEKRNPRSNIFASDFGASGVTGYGTTYLR